MFVSRELWKFWYLVFATIAIEAITIMLMLKYPVLKSLAISIVGNVVSALAGTFLLMWVMLLWHFSADWIMPHGTFDTINWVATYLLMCLGSVLIEAFTIKFIFNETIKRVFIPLLIGNLLTYCFIAWSAMSKAG